MLLVFLSSGLFLGWSLGANDAANIFGTAVGSKMIRFKTAALIAAFFVVIGAVVSGAGASHTLGKLGSVNAIGGAFTVASAAGFTVYWMTRLKLPVSTSQAIVGAIIGWNLFAGAPTDTKPLYQILSTWLLCPILAALFAMVFYSAFRLYRKHVVVHLLRVDRHTRTGLMVVGAFGAYSLGANNIANVMGVFIPVTSFGNFDLGLFSLNNTQILFLLGGLAIAVGIFTYSQKVMETVGGSLMKISPTAAFVIVLSEALVLFLFSSQSLHNWLMLHHLPPVPLVPVSSSQAVIGAVIGIGIIRGGHGIHLNVLKEVVAGWVMTPIMAGVISFVALFFLQNVFNQTVYNKTTVQHVKKTEATGSIEQGFLNLKKGLLASPEAKTAGPGTKQNFGTGYQD